MKKVLFWLSVLFFQFIFLTGVNAATGFEYGCRYIRPSDGDDYVLLYKQVGTTYEVIGCDHNGQPCGENYEHIIDRNASLGRTECPGSIDVIKKGDKVTTKWVTNHQGEYKYGEKWSCLYRIIENKSTVTDKFYSIDIYDIDEVSYYMYMKRTDCNKKDIVDSNGNIRLDIEPDEVKSYCKTEKKYEIKGFKEAIKNSKNSLSSKECPTMRVSLSGDKYIVEGIDELTQNKTYLKGKYITDSYKNKKSTTNLNDITGSISCVDYKKKSDCENNYDNINCTWISDDNKSPSEGYCEFSDLASGDKVSCGSGKGKITQIPSKFPELTSFAMRVIQVAVPVLLILLGVIDLFKGITAGKEDEMKKGQQMLIKRLIFAVIIFFVIVVVKFIISIVANTNKTNIIDCIDCFVSNNCNDSTNNQQPDINSNLFVGDSRTEDMCLDYGLCEGSPYIAGNSMGYEWFGSTAIPEINKKIKNENYNIIILLGVNDVGEGNNGQKAANNYYSKIYNLATTSWKNQNIIFVSVNPISDKYEGENKNSGVISFNKQMKSKIASSKLSNLKYCDTYSKIDINKIVLPDGMHYSKDGTKQIYDIIKNNCLK